MWYRLRGFELPDAPTTRSTVGHSHVLEPHLRTPHNAHHVARRLMAKAASRLRRYGMVAGHVWLSLRYEDRARFKGHTPVQSTQDTFMILEALDTLWKQAAPDRKIKKVAVSLTRLSDLDAAPAELFHDEPQKSELFHAVDALNLKYGQRTVHLGMDPILPKDVTTKIAFTRIPEHEEFFE